MLVLPVPGSEAVTFVLSSVSVVLFWKIKLVKLEKESTVALQIVLHTHHLKLCSGLLHCCSASRNLLSMNRALCSTALRSV